MTNASILHVMSFFTQTIDATIIHMYTALAAQCYHCELNYRNNNLGNKLVKIGFDLDVLNSTLPGGNTLV